MRQEPLGSLYKAHRQWQWFGLLLLATSLWMAGWVQASVRTMPTSPIRGTESRAQTVQPAGIATPSAIQPAGTSVTPPPIKASGAPGSAAPRLDPPDANDSDDENIRKLEAVALGNPRKGSAAERTAGRAAWLLGLLNLHGEHTPADRVQAMKWFERARVLREPLAAAGLAWCEIDGCSGPPSASAARSHIAQLKRTQPGLAAYLDWKIHERMAPVQGPSTSSALHVDPDAQRLQLLQQAAQAGNVSALNELGLNNVTASRYPQALAQFEAAASRSPAAASNAALLRVRMQQQQKPQQGDTDIGVPSRSPEQLYSQARRYHRGDGVPSNYTEAIRLYQLAAASGSQSAKRMLELIYSRPAPGGMVNVAWMSQLATMDVTAEGAILSFYAPPTPLLFVRDLTPLYEFIPQEWRKDRSVAQR